MKAGTLTEKNAFAAVLHDFSTNGGYGHCYIAQVPRGATVSTLESRLARLARDWTADLVIIDYLALLQPGDPAPGPARVAGGDPPGGRQLATTYQDGLGVPVLSPWQVRREARDEASKRGGYILSALSETAEASNTADMVMSLLEPDADDSRGRGRAAEAVGAEKPGRGARRRAARPDRRLRHRFLRPGRPGYQS